MEDKKINIENSLVLKYVKNQIRDLFHVTFSTLIKGAVVLTEDQFIEIMPAAWELLLETNQETAATAASFFILASVKAASQASEIMQKALRHKDPNVRICAILRYQVLWKSRFQVWPRMEESAYVTFKIPPPGIEFTLPSPRIGIECLPVVDPYWSPRQQSKDVEVEERHRHFVTATKTRKKQQTDAIKYAMQQQENKNREERHSFSVTTIPIVQKASQERHDHPAGEDHDMEEEDGARTHLHVAHSLFPSILCASVMQIVASLDDCAVGGDGTAVYEVK